MQVFCKKNAKIFCQFKKKQYLCTRFSKKQPLCGVGLSGKVATVAQLVEQRIRNAWVGGSSPPSGSKKKNHLEVVLFRFGMKHAGYIVLLLLSIGIRLFTPEQQAVALSADQVECTIQSMPTPSFDGIHGEPVIIHGGWSVETYVPTHFSVHSERTSFGKHRTRTCFLRRMLLHYQSYFIAYRGEERSETTPFCASTGSAYYVYALRRLLC